MHYMKKPYVLFPADMKTSTFAFIGLNGSFNMPVYQLIFLQHIFWSWILLWIEIAAFDKTTVVFPPWK